MVTLFFSLSTNAQTALPYYTGFDNTAERAGWTFYNSNVTQFSGWEYSLQPYSTPTCVIHFYPVGGSQTTTDWFVSPAFDFSAGGTIDSLWTNFGGFTNTLALNDTIAIYLLEGSANPGLATKTLLYDFRGANYVNDNNWRKFTNIVIPPTQGQSHIAFYYRTITSWLDVKFDNLQLSASVAVPSASFSASPDPRCPTQPVVFNDLSANTPTAWTWTFPGGSPAASSVKNPTVTYANAGMYTVSLVSSNQAGSSPAVSQTLNINACTGYNEQNQALRNILVYPNPGAGDLYIRSEETNNIRYSLYNALGETLITRQLEKNSTAQIPMALQPDGLYFLEIADGINSRIVKVLKE